MKKKPFFLKTFWKNLGPGLVTGSSDDDPSGIATYSQAGAQFGLTTLWTAFISFPLMAAVQEMCGRIGLVSGKGLSGTLKMHYPKTVLYLMILFSFPAIILNIGANIAGMGAVGNLLFPSIEASYFSVCFTVILLVLIIYLPYEKIASVLKYLCLVLLVYFIVPFLYKQDIKAILSNTFFPKIQFSQAYLATLVAILGTTISPYLFFWQATMSVEDLKHQKKKLVVNKKIIAEMRQDIDIGMLFSNLVMGAYCNGIWSNILGGTAFMLMLIAAVGLLLMYIF